MLSFHAPHNLYAEISLMAIGLCVFAYRFCGSNEWLKTHGLILVAYYSVGGIVYDELEGWPLLDTAYFLTVTITTVGYGDICPTTPEGKLFTVFYALVGIVFVFAALTPLVDALLFVKDRLLKPITPKDPTAEDCDDGSFDLDDLRKGGNWRFKYAAALAGPFLIFVLGLVIGFVVMGYDTVDGVYWSMITMTTIGYGDLSASTWLQQAVLMIYLPTAVAALADALGVVQTIGTAKTLCETNFDERVDELLLGEAGGARPNPDETLTEAEFLISVLKDQGIVDDMTVTAIRLQFAHIVRHNTSANEHKVLDDKMVFCELRAQGRIVQTSPDAPQKTSAGFEVETVDMTAKDGGFAEWRKSYWWPRVFDGFEHGSGEVRSAVASSAGASAAAAAAGFGAGVTGQMGAQGAASGAKKTVTEGGEAKTFTQLEETGAPPAAAEATDKGSGDTPLWLFLLLLVCVFIWQIFNDSLPGPAAPNPYEGWALSSVEEGDAITPQMLTELQQLMGSR